MIVLTEQDVLSLLSSVSVSQSEHLLSKLHDTLRTYSNTKQASPSEKTIYQPDRELIVTRLGNTTLFMPSSVTTKTAIKVVTVSSTGLKGCINVFAPDGKLLGVLNAEEITAFRTSLAVMIPYVRWPRSKANIVVFGAGRQAQCHIRLALLLSTVKHVTVINRQGPRGLQQLFSDLEKVYPDVAFHLLLKSASDYESRLQDALSSSDVIFCCTPATSPHFSYSQLDTRPRFISLIGSYKPSMHEIDTATLLSGGRIYVDTVEGCLGEAGELISAGVKEDALVEVGQLPDASPLPAEKNLVFKCVGLGIMDLVMAEELLEMAKERGLGTNVEAF